MGNKNIGTYKKVKRKVNVLKKRVEHMNIVNRKRRAESIINGEGNLIIDQPPNKISHDIEIDFNHDTIESLTQVGVSENLKTRNVEIDRDEQGIRLSTERRFDEMREIETGAIRQPTYQVDNDESHNTEAQKLVINTQHDVRVPTTEWKGNNEDNTFYEVEYEKENIDVKSIEGRRIVDIRYFLERIKEISDHGKTFGCSFSNIAILSEKRAGFHSQFKCVCNMCNITFNLSTYDKNDTDKLDANKSAVAGAMAIGCGFSQLEEFVSMLDVPCFTESTYNSIHMELVLKWEEAAIQSMTEAAAREREAAILEGRFSPDGTPMVDVIADGCWSKRSYKNKYDALSGAAAIVGKRFGEVVYFGVRNKYCAYCSWYENYKKCTVPQHLCFKNYEGASTGMESEILLEGFRKSVEMYGLIYARLIADGDASTYAKIVRARPYKNVTVEKIECKNHLMRNICTKLKALSSDKRYPPKLRKYVTQEVILNIRRVVKKSVEWLNNKEIPVPEKTLSLHNNILNASRHAFGDHTKCESYYCSSPANNEENRINELLGTNLWLQISLYLTSLAAHARSLISDVDSNKVEQFNSLIAKIIGGKRVNYCNRGSYHGRCNAAVVSHNSRTPLSVLSKTILGHTPKSRIKKLEQRRNRKRVRNSSSGKKFKRKLLFPVSRDKDYGSAQTPDLTEEVFHGMKEHFLKELATNAQNREKIERNTVQQSDSSEWLELRRKLLTASNFGKVCKRRLQTSCANLVKAIVAPRNLSSVTAVAHGKKFEKIAIQQLSEQEGIEIKPCGIFIDKDIPYLGATPDGITEDAIIEVKCPISVFKFGFEESIRLKKNTFWHTRNGNRNSINKNHDWYYQIQGQMHITGKSKCVFGLWYGHDKRVIVEYILKDDEFWKREMLEKLKIFYNNCLLPEILDSRMLRKMPLRECKSTRPQPKPKINPIRRFNRGSASEISDSTRNHDDVRTEEVSEEKASISISGTESREPHTRSEYVLSFEEL